MAVRKIKEVKNCWDMEDGSIRGYCKNNYMNKYEWNREGEIS